MEAKMVMMMMKDHHSHNHNHDQIIDNNNNNNNNNGDTEEEEVGGESNSAAEKNRKKGRSPRGGGGPNNVAAQPCCQAERCPADLSDAKRYHRRHKVCELHSKAPVVHVAGLRQRFCQQCSRFHELSEFDEAKKSCRRRLAGHNERRRKSSVECYGGGEGGSATKQYQMRSQTN